MPAPAQYSGGTGEPNNPYQIATAADLIALGETPDDYNKHFILTADINLDPNLPGRRVFDRSVIAPDANAVTDDVQGPAFTGVFDGNDHTISHLTIEGGGYLGLFGQTGSGTNISNLSLRAVEISGTDHVGGLVGYNVAGKIRDCCSGGTIRGDNAVGGLAGENSDGSISSSYSTAAVNGNGYVGGLVGNNYSSPIAASHATGTVYGSGDCVGGLVGLTFRDAIVASYSTGSVRGDDYVGGLVGLCSDSSIVASYSTASVRGYWKVGGLVGDGDYSIAASYSSGAVSGHVEVGGLVGGDVRSYRRVRSSFWDVETSGQPTSAEGTGKTTTEMQDTETFLSAGWDCVDETPNGTCDFWQVSPGEYPRLRDYGSDHPVMPEGQGTPEAPYLIRDARDLGTVWFRPFAHYRLTQSIDLSGIKWPTAVVPGFGGGFNGDGYVISNLHVEGAGYLGLFGHLHRAATVSSLGLRAVEMSGFHNVGGLAGWNHGNIAASYSSGSVRGDRHVGGLVANNWATIAASYSAGGVRGDLYVGGFAGWNTGTIMDSYSTSAVAGYDEVGGLAGFNAHDGNIIDSYSAGPVSGDRQVGGLVGNDQSLSIDSSFWDTETSGQWWSDGGVGRSTAKMQMASTFLDAGWDVVGETADGTKHIWWILEGQDYPRLWWELLTDDAVVFVVDDFEDYNDVPGYEIWDTWIDSYDTPLPNGGMVGHMFPPYAERTIVHSGLQSMPFYYANTEGIANSTAYRGFYPAQDWTADDAAALVLWSRGVADNDVDAFYVAVNSKIIFNPDPNAVLADTWTPWIIPLSSLVALGVDTEHVTGMEIGIGDDTRPSQNARGILYIDDIRLVKRAQ